MVAVPGEGERVHCKTNASRYSSRPGCLRITPASIIFVTRFRALNNGPITHFHFSGPLFPKFSPGPLPFFLSPLSSLPISVVATSGGAPCIRRSSGESSPPHRTLFLFLKHLQIAPHFLVLRHPHLPAPIGPPDSSICAANKALGGKSHGVSSFCEFLFCL